MKPRIGVTAGFTQVDIGPVRGQVSAEKSPTGGEASRQFRVRGEYPAAVEAGGGEPVVLAPLAEGESLDGLQPRRRTAALGWRGPRSGALGRARHPAAELIDPAASGRTWRSWRGPTGWACRSWASAWGARRWRCTAAGGSSSTCRM